jgi:hypothetical protein
MPCVSIPIYKGCFHSEAALLVVMNGVNLQSHQQYSRGTSRNFRSISYNYYISCFFCSCVLAAILLFCR